MKIVKIKFEDTIPYRKNAKKEHVSFNDRSTSEWFGIYNNDILVSFYCIDINGEKARFRSNYTVNYFRKRGCLNNFIKHAIGLCKEKKVEEMTCFCTEMSYNSHIKNGAKLISKKKMYYVKYYINSLELK